MFKNTLKWVAIGGIFAIPVILPFIVSSSMFFPYITGKNFTFRVIVEIMLVAWVLLALLDARYRPRFSWILASLALFVAVVGLADVFGENPFKSIWSNFERMEGYVAILHLFAYFLVASTVLNSEKIWNAFWYSSLGASVAVAFVGLKPVFEAFPSIPGARIDATFGNAIYLAIYTLFHIFIALILMARWRGTHWHQVILGFVAVLHVATMIFTHTRGTVLGLLGGAVVTIALIVFFEREKKILRWLAVGALAFIMVVVGAVISIKDTDFAKGNPVLSRFTQMSLSEGTLNARFMNWGMAWQGVQERPLLGWGQGNYEYVFSKYHDPYMYAEEPWFDRTHNIFFDWMVAAGFLGIITYLLIPVTLLTHLWVLDPKESRWSLKSLTSFSAIRTLIAKRDHHFTATERALWTGLLAAYMFHNLFVFDNIISYILFFSILAYLHWRVTEGHSPLLEEVEVSRETVVAVALPVALVIGGLTLWYVNVPGIKTSQALISALMPQVLADGQRVQRAPESILEYYKTALSYDQLGRQEVREQLVQMAARMQRTEGVSVETKNAFAQLSLDEVKYEVARNPGSPRLQLFAGALYGNFGRMQEAETALRTAVDAAPTKQTAIFQLAELFLIQGKTEDALELFKRAYELAPEYDEARKLYALVLIRSGKDKEAVDLLTERYGTAAVDDTRLFNEWTNAKRYDISVEILQARVEKDPANIQTRISLAAGYKELGDKKKAIAVLEGIKAEYPEHAAQIDSFIKDIRGW